MRLLSLALAATAGLLVLPASPAPAPAATAAGGLTVLRASVAFGRERAGGPAGGPRARLRLEGDAAAGDGLAAHRPGDGGLHLSLGPLVLFDGAPPANARIRMERDGAWRLRVTRVFEGRGRLSIRMLPWNGTFVLKGAGLPAGALREAGPAGVAVALAVGGDAGGETLDFDERSPRRWEYRHVNVPRPPPPGGGGGGGGGGGSFGTLAQGTSSLITGFRFEAARDAASWNALWTAHGGAGPAPAVDFSAEMVVGVWLGTKPTGGVTVDILSVTPASVIGAPCSPDWCPPTGAMAVIRESQWGPTCGVTQALSQPFHIVRAPRVDGPVLYEMMTLVNDCP